MKQFLCSACMACVFINASHAQTKPKVAVKPAVKAAVVPKPLLKNAIDSFSYAAGINIANSMKGQGIPAVNASLMAQAMNEVFAGKKTFLTDEQAGMTLQEKLQQFAEGKAKAAKAEAAVFFAQNKTKPGVVALPNGMQYIILNAGEANGQKPTAADTVVVNYAGTLVDGKEFDNSYKRGEPATFPLGGVIKGWTEILQLMPKGAKWKVFIPSELGYGEQGAGGMIPPNATLVFDIELLDIKPAS